MHVLHRWKAVAVNQITASEHPRINGVVLLAEKEIEYPETIVLYRCQVTNCSASKTKYLSGHWEVKDL